MKKQLTMTTAMAAALMALPGCSSGKDDWNGDVVADKDTAVCVDKEGKRVDDSECAPATTVNNYNSGYHGGGSNAFLWYYIGRQSAVPYYGESIHDRRFVGSYQARAGTVYHSAPESTRMSRSSAVSRGGLGSSSRRFGSFGRS